MSIMLLLLVSSAPSIALQNISAATSREIVEIYAGRPFTNFRGFATELYFNARQLFTLDQRKAIGAFTADKVVTPSERELLFRLLGIYTQLKYGGDAIRVLGELVAIPTHQVDGVANHKNKEFKRFGKSLGRLARILGLKYRNVNNRVFEISFKGRSGKLVGLHAHADVVPANSENWVLSDGTKLDPFRMTRIGDRLYGRGTQDNKNAIVAVMYAMRVLQEEKITFWNEVKLIIDTTEETTSTAIPYYFKRNPIPDYNIALDGVYPVVTSEKGFALLKTIFPRRAGRGEGLEFIGLTGGLAYKQIPAISQVEVLSDAPARHAGKLRELANQFLNQHGNNFSIEIKPAKAGLLLKLIGVSAHSSAPESGVNPIPRLLLFIDFVGESLALKSNHLTDAARYVKDNWGSDYLGTQFGIAYSHDFMGPLTAAFTKVVDTADGLELAVNLRLPLGRDLTELEAQVRSKIVAWKQQNNIELELSWRAKEAMYVDPNGKWVQALSSIASENLDLPAEFASSAGGTSIHFLPNGVQFGLSMPNEKYTGHNANEFKSLEQFLVDMQVVTEMLIRIGQMNHLH